MIKDYTRISLINLRKRHLRSWITTLGVIISVAAIIILIMVSNGLKFAISEQFNKIGSNKIFISSAGGMAGFQEGLTTKDVESLERVSDIKIITPALMDPAAKVEFNREEIYGMVTGWPAKDMDLLFDAYDIQFAEGRVFGSNEKGATIVGHLIGTEIFDREVHIRNSILINGKKFEVVGVMETLGNSEDDKNIFIPIEEARELFGKPDEVSYIDITVKDGVDVEAVSKRIERQLDRDRSDDNFRVMSPTQILKFLNTTLGIVQGILVSIAAISLLVGAVGIMNMMFTSVLERTKEIGVMKSIGAKNSDVLLLFMIEAGLIGLVGGAIGTFFGVVISLGIGLGAAAAGFAMLKIQVDFTLILLALLGSTVVGMISGALPARRAAYLHPVDALRWS